MMEKKRILEGFFIFLIGFFIFSANIWGISIYSLDEAKNAECAREMLERSDLIVPTFNYELRTDKPPVHYYFMMLAYKMFGVNEFSARFFSSIFGGLLVLITFLFAKRYFGFYTAFFSFLVLISSIHMAVQFHMAVPDPYLIFWINASLFSFFVWYKERKDIFLYSFYIFSGLGVLTKGPVAVVLPFFIVASFLALKREISFKTLKELKIIRGLLIILIIALPWYVAVGLKTNWKWVEEFIFKHNIHRFSQPMEGHGGIFLITFLYVFIGLLPFSVFIPQAVYRAFNERKNDTFLFLLLIAGIYTGFFAISKTKLPNYTVPVYPSLAIIIGYFISSIKNKVPKSVIWSGIFYLILSIFLVLLLYVGIKGEKEISDLSYLAFFFFILTFGGILFLLLLKRDWYVSVLSLSLTSILTSILFFFYIFPKVDKRNPVVQMMPFIDKAKPIRYYMSFNPAFVFYIRKHIKPLKKEEIRKFLYQKETVYILSRDKYKKDILKYKRVFLLKRVKDLFENKISILVSNRNIDIGEKK